MEDIFADLVVFRSPMRGSEGRRIREGLQEISYYPPRERRTIFQGSLVAGCGRAMEMF